MIRKIDEATLKQEAFEKASDEDRKKKISDIISRLKSENFGNKEQRSAMSAMIGSLGREANSGNDDAKKFLKELGKMMTNWSDGNFNKEEPKKVKESVELSVNPKESKRILNSLFIPVDYV